MKLIIQCIIDLLNVICFYLFHRKFLLKTHNQKCLWEERLERDYAAVKIIEQDHYYQELDKYVLQKLKDINSENYLEVGCFFGYRLNKFASELKNKKFTGIDIGGESLLFGKRKIINTENINMVQANACFLPFRDKSFETIYTVVSLTHISYSDIKKAIMELQRVAAKNIFLIEVDCRPMGLLKKIECINWNYGYMHKYEKLFSQSLKLVKIEPLYLSEEHPRYTAFHFVK